MAERLLQSTAFRAAFKVLLTSDHLTGATGKTVAVTISKNGAAFGNPSGGATNATEIGNGWYYVDLTTTDTGTLGPLIVRGTAASCDPTETPHTVAVPAQVNLVSINGDTAAATVLGALVSDESGANIQTFWANGGNINGETLSGGLTADLTKVTGVSLASHAAGLVPVDVYAFGAISATTSGGQPYVIVNSMQAGVIGSGTFASGALTAAAIAADAIGSSELAQSAIDEIVAALGASLTNTGLVTGPTNPGAQVVEQFIEEDISFSITFDAATDITGATWEFTISQTQTGALEGSGLIEFVNADMDVSGQVVTADLTGGESAALEAGSYHFALRRTDTGNRRVVAWGQWVVVG